VLNVEESAFKNWLFPALIIVALCLGMFSPWLVTGKALAPFDLAAQMLQPWGPDILPVVQNHYVLDGVTHHIPYRLLSEKALREDGYVGWNPLQLGGTAQHANTMVLN
jgi:hypothetical protein